MNIFDHPILFDEMKACFNFFWETSNHTPNSPGYGLMPDRSNNPQVASIAAVGFALSSYVIGVQQNWISYQQGVQRTLGTLETLCYRVPHFKGFFVHFCNTETAERHQQSEYSTIDTALALNGIIVADAFFKNEAIQSLTRQILERVDWPYFTFTQNEKTLFHMAYNDLKDGDYSQGKAGFISAWSMYAEQLGMYILAAGHPNTSTLLAQSLYNGFDRPMGEYGGYRCIYEPGGTLFVYHYSHAWFNFATCQCTDGINWAENSRNAALAQIAYCKDNANYETFRQGYWGISASDSPSGYYVGGAFPSAKEPHTNGTIAPSAIAGSVVFTPAESIAMLEKLYNEHPNLWGKYGFKDAYNADANWYSSDYLGIDKGISLLMINNAFSSDFYSLFAAHPYIQNAVKKLGWSIPAI